MKIMGIGARSNFIAEYEMIHILRLVRFNLLNLRHEMKFMRSKPENET